MRRSRRSILTLMGLVAVAGLVAEVARNSEMPAVAAAVYTGAILSLAAAFQARFGATAGRRDFGFGYAAFGVLVLFAGSLTEGAFGMGGLVPRLPPSRLVDSLTPGLQRADGVGFVGWVGLHLAAQVGTACLGGGLAVMFGRASRGARYLDDGPTGGDRP